MIPDTTVYNNYYLFESSDKILRKLEEVNDSIQVIICNTEPITDMEKYVTLSEGAIAIIALGISIFALVVSFLCFHYQKLSAKLLKIANQRKPNLYPIVRKIYDNSITLQIIYEYDSDYTMSYTIEQRHPKEKRSSIKKHFFYMLYPSESLLCKMKLPEDVIMLEKYEVYKNDDIFNMAFAIMDYIIKYNESIERAISHIQDKSIDDRIKKDKDDLLSYSRKLLRMMYDLDELVRKEETSRFNLRYKNKFNRQLERDMSLFVASRFFAKARSVTSDIVVADPFFVLTGSVIDTPQNLAVAELHKKHQLLSKNKPKRQFDSEETIDKYLKNAVCCIDLINNREREDIMDSSFITKCKKSKETTWLYRIYHSHKNPRENRANFNLIIDNTSKSVLSRLRSFLVTHYRQVFNVRQKPYEAENAPFKDGPLRRNIENILGGFCSNRKSVYDVILKQLDEGVLDMEHIIRYDTMLQIFINKHSLLSESSIQKYNNEKRRVERKKILMNEKEKQLKENDH